VRGVDLLDSNNVAICTQKKRVHTEDISTHTNLQYPKAQDRRRGKGKRRGTASQDNTFNRVTQTSSIERQENNKNNRKQDTL